MRSKSATLIRTFVFSDAQPSALSAPRSPSVVVGPTPRSGDVAPLLRLLVVQDSSADEALVVRALAHGGYEVVHDSVDGPAALTDALDRQAWDVVVADYTM